MSSAPLPPPQAGNNTNVAETAIPTATRVSNVTIRPYSNEQIGVSAGRGDAPPTFVYAIFVSLFVLLNSFAVNQALRYKRFGRWRDYRSGLLPEGALQAKGGAGEGYVGVSFSAA